MSEVFISYARRDDEVVKALVGDIKFLGKSVWIDTETPGGQQWWEQILANIQKCNVVIVAVSRQVIFDSPYCKAEWSYAKQLDKQILPVLVADDLEVKLLPDELKEFQCVDYHEPQSKGAFMDLFKALGNVPDSPPLPDPMPPPPARPISRLTKIKKEIDKSGELVNGDQVRLISELLDLASQPGHEADAKELLERLKAKHPLSRSTEDEVEAQIAFARIKNKVDSTGTLSRNEQDRLVSELEELSGEQIPQRAKRARDLLKRLRDHPGVSVGVRSRINTIIGKPRYLWRIVIAAVTGMTGAIVSLLFWTRPEAGDLEALFQFLFVLVVVAAVAWVLLALSARFLNLKL